jgi:hypothetical protein
MKITWDNDKREYSIHGLAPKELTDIRVAVLAYSSDRSLNEGINGYYRELWQKLVSATTASHE